MRVRIQGVQAASNYIDVVQSGNDGKGESRAQKSGAGNPDPERGMNSQQHNEDHGGKLRESIGLAENAGAEVAKSGDHVEQGAHDDDANVPAENHDRELPGDLVDDG